MNYGSVVKMSPVFLRRTLNKRPPSRALNKRQIIIVESNWTWDKRLANRILNKRLASRTRNKRPASPVVRKIVFEICLSAVVFCFFYDEWWWCFLACVNLSSTYEFYFWILYECERFWIRNQNKTNRFNMAFVWLWNLKRCIKQKNTGAIN